MNIQNLRVNYPKLISYMETNGYSKSYVDSFKREIKNILTMENLEEYSSYTDLYLNSSKASSHPTCLRQKRTIIGAIEQFDIHGRYPDRRHRHGLFDRGSYHLLSTEFQSVIDFYRKVESKRGKKPATINTEFRSASSFFLSLQKQGIYRLGDATEVSVLSIFMSSDQVQLKSCSYKKNVTAVLKACIDIYPDTCPLILSFLPALREIRKNIQYLTAEEINKFKEALINHNNSLTLGDRAIGMLALRTGMRCCDIAGLTLDSIVWRRDLITIRQQKTQILLELPLTAIVGNAIYDYLIKERPKTECSHLFVTQNRPHTRLKSGSVGNVAARIMKAADIRQSRGDRKGLHIFRHHLATALLGHGVPQPVISRTLGHSSPSSLEPYLRANFPHLKECAIDIARYPVPVEVFSHG